MNNWIKAALLTLLGLALIVGVSYLVFEISDPKTTECPQGVVGTQGQQGIRGLPGPRGEPGEDGERGPIGPVGSRGLTGPVGQTGPQGLQGIQGPIGLTGPKGQDGKDWKNMTSSEYSCLALSMSAGACGEFCGYEGMKRCLN